MRANHHTHLMLRKWLGRMCDVLKQLGRRPVTEATFLKLKSADRIEYSSRYTKSGPSRLPRRKRSVRRRSPARLRVEAAAVVKEFRVFTARKNVARIFQWLRILGLGFSSFECQGGWPASPDVYIAEKSIEIRIIAPDADEEKIQLLCYAIKALNHQEEVLVAVEKAGDTFRI